jgi:hypothetical protein
MEVTEKAATGRNVTEYYMTGGHRMAFWDGTLHGGI